MQIRTRIEQMMPDAKFDRVEELFRRTTQFNATGRQFAAAQLASLAAAPNARLFALHVSDRFADHGLVGAAVGARKGKGQGETSLFRQLLEQIQAGDVLVADRYYCAYWLIAAVSSVASSTPLRSSSSRPNARSAWSARAP